MRDSLASVSGSTLVSTYATAPSPGRIAGDPTEGRSSTKLLSKGCEAVALALARRSPPVPRGPCYPAGH